MPLFNVTVTLVEPENRENRLEMVARVRSCLEAQIGVGCIAVKFGNLHAAETPFDISVSETESMIRLDEAAKERLKTLIGSKLRQALWRPRLVDPKNSGPGP